MYKVKCIISYDGSNFFGWQRQKEFASIQQEIESALKKIFQKEILITGSGRTDRGVHATKQVASFSLPKNCDLNALKKSLNALLCDQIRIQNITAEKESFHARYDVKSKIYSYRINTKSLCCPFMRHIQYHHPYPVDIDLMKKSANLFIGTMDFSSFANVRPEKMQPSSNIRTIYDITFQEQDGLLTISFHGNGFLYKMVRNLTGALIDVGEKKVSLQELQEILEEKNNQHLLRQAPAHGLSLDDVLY